MAELKLDFYSKSNQLLLNPRYSDEDRAALTKLGHSFGHLKNHFWLSTSGSSGNPKLTALSGSAILASAKAVNDHIEAHTKDSWLLALPLFHVGGLGILARASLTNSVVAALSGWSPLDFITLCNESRSTLTALVPTQLIDLLSLDQSAPKSLRVCIIGGGSLSERIYLKARSLGWPILPSFGMTECASQVATAPLSSLAEKPKGLPPLCVLPHVKALRDDDGVLVIESAALFSGYGESINNKPFFVDPKIKGRFVTSDLISLKDSPEGTSLTPLGRLNESLKVLGELVSLTKLDTLLAEIAKEVVGISDACIIALPDRRAQHTVNIVAVGEPDSIRILSQRYDQTVMPFERATRLFQAVEIPRSPLGKLARRTMTEMVKAGKVVEI